MSMNWRNGAPGRLYRQVLSSFVKPQTRSNTVPGSQPYDSGELARNVNTATQARARTSKKGTCLQLCISNEGFLVPKDEQE